MVTQTRPWGRITTTGTNSGWRLLAGAVFGIFGSIVMAMWAMAMGLIQMGDLWASPKAIAATFLGDAAMQPGFAAGPVMLGMVFHLVNGVWLGAIFGLITPRLRLAQAIVAGLVFGVVEGFGALWFVLPWLDPTVAGMGNSNIVSWVIEHLLFGFGVGLYPLVRAWGWFGET